MKPSHASSTHIPFMLATACGLVGFRFFGIDDAGLPGQLLVMSSVAGYTSQSHSSPTEVEVTSSLFQAVRPPSAREVLHNRPSCCSLHRKGPQQPSRSDVQLWKLTPHQGRRRSASPSGSSAC
jgi:hypothetical protein